jgi:hypothetical protein
LRYENEKLAKLTTAGTHAANRCNQLASRRQQVLQSVAVVLGRFRVPRITFILTLHGLPLEHVAGGWRGGAESRLVVVVSARQQRKLKKKCLLLNGYLMKCDNEFQNVVSTFQF